MLSIILNKKNKKKKVLKHRNKETPNKSNNFISHFVNRKDANSINKWPQPRVVKIAPNNH
jgi:hypothetical protein